MKKDNEPTVYFRLPVRSGYEISRDGDRILIRQLDMADSEISIEIGDFDRILVALEQLHDKLRKEGAL